MLTEVQKMLNKCWETAQKYLENAEDMDTDDHSKF